MAEPIRILHVLGNVNLGGAESRIMDLYRHMDRQRIQFDFLVHTAEPGHFDEEIKQLGGRIYRLPRFRFINLGAYRKAVRLFFREHHQFRCVQGHITSTAAIYLPAAKAAGIPLTAAHVRNAGVDKGLKGMAVRLMRFNLSKKADFLFACSELAGIAAFGRKAVAQGKTVYIPNAIDPGPFRYNPAVRGELRAKLKLDDQYVLGHVGRFNYQKNHQYLIKIFYEFQKSRPDSRLILLGVGPGMDEAKRLCRESGIEEKVLFLGNQSKVSDYYQAMDYFVFPSIFEGLPGTVVEAQAAGLRCLISDQIAPEVMITRLVQCKGIDLPPEEWAKAIKETAGYSREDMVEAIRTGGFDVNDQAVRLARFYETGQISAV